jgi:hypothetical protein
MDTSVITIIAVACAGLGAVSTVVYYIFKAKELRVLREIRDRLPK